APRNGLPPVAIVGSGPAGLSCAYYLSVLGASVTVYEADERPGGRLAWSIPEYRLPGRVLEGELEALRARGIDIRTGCRIGPGGRGIGELLEEHRALFLAVGAQRSVGLQIPGAEAALDFQDVLRGAKGGSPLPLGERVAVVGGGDAAVDVCRTALRTGAGEVHLIYRRTREEMPARADEVAEAAREGVRFHFQAAPDRYLPTAGGGGELLLRRTRPGPRSGSRHAPPVLVEGEEGWALGVDALVAALGQRVGGDLFDDPALQGLRRLPDGRVWAEARTQRTTLERVYAGGDAVLGAAAAVEAMFQGRRAALALYAACAPEELPAERLADRRLRRPFPGHRETAAARVREEMPRLPVDVRRGGFGEVEEGYGEPAARREAGRCLQCHREL
ncbi:MAG: FAD-dependent oxidoreductase, partial [Deferrisomatales bacterium]